MKSNQVEELNQKLAELLTTYGVEGNYLVTYIMIDEETGHIAAPSIANISPVPAHGVSRARGAGFLAEVVCDTLLSVLRSYCGLDILSAAGALRGMVEEARGNQMLQRQMEHARAQNNPVPTA